ncbi:MAG: hypothetical protein KAJ15_00215 [Spirochaetes bacterium]|nr:hypothetical protein [Spirochaetota bacterium]
MIKTVKKLVPVCSNCKKIRLQNTDPGRQDSWVKAEVNDKGMLFTHGLCPECAKKLYGDFFK